MKKSKYFKIQEFVSPAVYNKFGELAWQFIDEKLIDTMDFIKEKSGKTITVNNWPWKGNNTQRGLRENICDIVKEKTLLDGLYLSPHIFGKAVDFDIKGMTAEDVRDWLFTLDLPYNIRLEIDVPWVHLDVFDRGEKIYLF